MNAILQDPALRLFAICTLVLCLKMFAMSFYTSTLRLRRGVFGTPEDYKMQGMPLKAAADEGIERVRRAHRNDLENVLPFFAVGLIYALSGASMLGAQINFIGFTLARILHSIFYVRGMQPHRTLAFTVAGLLQLWMLVSAGWTLLSAA